jgi:tRNA(adenine34) deaminase
VSKEVTALDQLPDPWAECYRLAWDAFCAGSVPCGSLLVDGTGTIVGRGRNRAYEPSAPMGQLGNTGLAHAEINALVGLPAGVYADHILYSSLEPCVLCVGATVMSAVGTMRFAGHDSWSGATSTMTFPELVETIPTIEGPVSEPFGVFGAAIYLVRLVQRDPQDRVVEHHRRNHERDVAAAERMIDGGVLNRGANAGARLDDMWPEIAELL